MASSSAMPSSFVMGEDAFAVYGYELIRSGRVCWQSLIKSFHSLKCCAYSKNGADGYLTMHTLHLKSHLHNLVSLLPVWHVLV